MLKVASILFLNTICSSAHITQLPSETTNKIYSFLRSRGEMYRFGITFRSNRRIFEKVAADRYRLLMKDFCVKNSANKAKQGEIIMTEIPKDDGFFKASQKLDSLLEYEHELITICYAEQSQLVNLGEAKLRNFIKKLADDNLWKFLVDGPSEGNQPQKNQKEIDLIIYGLQNLYIPTDLAELRKYKQELLERFVEVKTKLALKEK